MAWFREKVPCSVLSLISSCPCCISCTGTDTMGSFGRRILRMKSSESSPGKEWTGWAGLAPWTSSLRDECYCLSGAVVSRRAQIPAPQLTLLWNQSPAKAGCFFFKCCHSAAKTAGAELITFRSKFPGFNGRI